MTKLDSQAEAYRARLQRTIEENGKLEYLYGIEQFQFFLNWLKNSRDKLSQQILTGKNSNGALLADKEHWHAMGGYNALNDVIEAGSKFANKAAKARKILEKFDKDIADMPEAMKRAE